MSYVDLRNRICQEMVPVSNFDGLIHTLLCTRNTRIQVYCLLYKQLKMKGIGHGIKTFIFPNWINDILRARFFEGEATYDNYFRPDVYYVTNQDLSVISNVGEEECLLCC